MKQCCIEGCVNECTKGRRYCREHYLQRKREQAKIKCLQFGRYKYKRICEICDKEFNGDRPNSRFCSIKCYHKYSRINSSNATHNYSYERGGHSLAHRSTAEKTLNRKLGYNEVVHRIDGNVSNNNPTNLIVISRSDHVRLHAELTRKRASLLKSSDENSENCWNNLIDQITTTWLETTGVKVIKISDIGQSAAEPYESEEGSETMHGTPNRFASHGDDIVQTTTQRGV